MPSPSPPRALPAPGPWALVLLALLVSLPLALAPGYFSHDELQWAARAESLRHVPWWPAADQFQFRPLTFNLWMALSRALFAQPQAFHAVLVAWGALNAGLVCAVGRRFGMTAWGAAIGALLFVLSPYAVYVHGWVGTIADLIWVSAALVVAWCALRMTVAWQIGVLAFVVTAIALLGKEAAVSIPLLACVGVVFDRARRVRWGAVVIGSGLAATAFVLWRLPALLHAPRDGVAYVPSLANVPMRWIEYQLFTPIIGRMEASTVFLDGVLRWPVLVAIVVCIAVFAALWRARPVLAWVWLAAGVASLAPVLLLGQAWNHYAYAYAIVTALCLATAWPMTSGWRRCALLAFGVLSVLHGGFVMYRMVYVAKVQAVFSPALVRAVDGHTAVDPLRLRVGDGAKPWIFERLTHEIPGIGTRVVLVETAPDYVIQPDGTLTAARTSLPTQ
ncbi:hypothetical protein LYSHEL_14760 [Lysobacter helvus]|uniref:Glycosyltransferase RgtA/B/C/D-like domain-containing protein n=2 Tax=Lysobacteraceae TaxID=32033 RepID=A0ABN6FRZ8_9GAMM|nr:MULTISPECIES: hypothetical protein [Lysobacter]BCT92452.1 hypothetical protein LYSCAS_14760 [Lysobacter caseinilyticus]BCT95605.1 hypothetical protein LYSHEL_14760 [Lysobacter helvus]